MSKRPRGWYNFRALDLWRFIDEPEQPPPSGQPEEQPQNPFQKKGNPQPVSSGSKRHAPPQDNKKKSDPKAGWDRPRPPQQGGQGQQQQQPGQQKPQPQQQAGQGSPQQKPGQQQGQGAGQQPGNKPGNSPGEGTSLGQQDQQGDFTRSLTMGGFGTPKFRDDSDIRLQLAFLQGRKLAIRLAVEEDWTAKTHGQKLWDPRRLMRTAVGFGVSKITSAKFGRPLEGGVYFYADISPSCYEESALFMAIVAGALSVGAKAFVQYNGSAYDSELVPPKKRVMTPDELKLWSVEAIRAATYGGNQMYLRGFIRKYKPRRLVILGDGDGFDQYMWAAATPTITRQTRMVWIANVHNDHGRYLPDMHNSYHNGGPDYYRHNVREGHLDYWKMGKNYFPGVFNIDSMISALRRLLR